MIAMIRLSEYLDFFMQNLLRIDYENILLKTSANLWGDYRTPVDNGISPDVFYDTLTNIDFRKLICFEVAEYNPVLDSTGLSLEYMGKILRLVEGRIKNHDN
jgi:hypothetical protein